MNLNQWAIRWGVPYAALEDLRREFGTDTDPAPIPGQSEAAVQTRVRLEATRKGLRLWRNNVGAYNPNHPPSPGTRWGLCNDSAKMNKIIKSSDLVGIRPITIQPEHVGGIIGQFVAREVKAADWGYSGTEREQAQLNFLELVASLGGDGAFCNQEGTL